MVPETTIYPHLCREEGCSTFLRNVGTYPLNLTTWKTLMRAQAYYGNSLQGYLNVLRYHAIVQACVCFHTCHIL